MSSGTSNQNGSVDLTDWDNLSPERQNLVKAAYHLRGNSPIERPEFKEEVEGSKKVKKVVDDKDDLLTTLNSTNLLNELVSDDYLRKTKQGGKSPIVIDGEYDDSRDNVEVAPFGVRSKLMSMAHQILDRENKSGSHLNGVNTNDFNAVISKVNNVVGRQVMYVNSDSSVYRFTLEGRSEADKRVNNALNS